MTPDARTDRVKVIALVAMMCIVAAWNVLYVSWRRDALLPVAILYTVGLLTLACWFLASRTWMSFVILFTVALMGIVARGVVLHSPYVLLVVPGTVLFMYWMIHRRIRSTL